MPRSVDERVVQMEFDNSKFDRNIRSSIDALNNLDSAINKSATSASLSHLNDAFKSINVSPISDGIETVTMKMSALGTIGDQVLRTITNGVIDGAKKMARAINTPMRLMEEGGKRRALNIANAKFQLKGLGIEWNQIEQDINYGVKDTAYGLDSAAKVASQLVASQVALGKDMQTALRGISGVAAMTNSTYDDIGRIYTTVAGNGRLMGDQLMQLSSRGMNASATLGKYLNKTESEVRDMVSKGKIDFNTFAAAMDSAFGEHAKAANQTFEGAMSNVKAALARTGVDVAAAGFEALKDIFNALIPLINDFNTAIKPVTTVLSKGIEKFSELAVLGLTRVNDIIKSSSFGSFFQSLGDSLEYNFDKAYRGIKRFIESDSITHILKGIANSFEVLAQVLRPIANAFRSVFNSGNSNAVNSLGAGFERFTNAMQLSANAQQGIDIAFTKVFEIVKKVIDIFGKAIQVIEPVAMKIHDAMESIFEGIAIRNIPGLSDAEQDLGSFTDFVIKVCNVLADLQNIIDGFSFDKFANGIADFIEKVMNFDFLDGVANLFKGIINTFKKVGEALKPIVDSIKPIFESLFSYLKEAFSKLDFNDIMQLVNNGLFATLILQLKEGFSVFSQISSGAKTIVEGFNNVFGSLSNTFKKMERSMNVKFLLMIAGALLMLSISLVLLSNLDVGQLAVSFTTLTACLVGLLKALDYISKDTKGALKASAAIFLLATALGSIALAMLLMSAISWEGLVKSIIGLGAGLAILVTALNFMNGAIPGALALVIVSGGLIAFAGAMLMLSKISAGGLIKALVGLGIGLAEVAAGLTAMLFALPGAIALSVASVGLIAFAGALAIIGKLKLWEIIKAIVGIAFGLGALAVGLTAMTFSRMGAESLKIAASSLLVLGAALGLIGKMKFWTIIKGLIGLGGALAILAVGLKYMTTSVAGAAALLIASAALMSLVTAIGLLGNMNLETLVKGIIALGAALIVIANGLFLMEAALPGAAAFAVFSAGILACGAGALMLASALAIVATIGGQAISSLMTGFKLLFGLLKPLFVAIADSFMAFIKRIVERFEELKELLKQLLLKLIDTLKEIIPQIVDAVLEFLNKIKERFPEFIKTGVELLLALIKGIKEKVPELIKNAIELVTTLIKAIGSKSKDVIGAGFQLVVDLINGVADALSEHTDELLDALDNLLKACWKFLQEAVKHAFDLGADFVKGFVKGIKGNKKDVDDAIKDTADSAEQGLKKGLDEHSPSKKADKAGVFFIKGFVNAIRRSTSEVLNTIGTLGSNIMSEFSSRISNISDESISPRISPVLDISNIDSYSGSISDALSKHVADLNGAINFGKTTINSVDESYNDNRNVVDAIGVLNERVSGLTDKMTNLKVVMSSGALVGEIAPNMDRALGERANSSKRATGASSVSKKVVYS